MLRSPLHFQVKMASTTGQKFAVHGRHNISWQDMPAPSFYSISSESGSGSGERGKEARANKRNDIILQAKGTTGDESGAAAGVGDGGGVGRGAGTRTKNRSAVRRLGDTYAIEIKPKQGWLQLASDVNDLFDLMPSGAVTKPKETTCNQEENEPSARDKCWCRFCSMQLLKVSGDARREGSLTYSFTNFDRCTMGKSNVWATTVRWIYFPGMSTSPATRSQEPETGSSPCSAQ